MKNKSTSIEHTEYLIVGLIVFSLLIYNIVHFEKNLKHNPENQINDENYKGFITFTHTMICILLSVGMLIMFIRFADANMRENKIIKYLTNMKAKKWFQLMVIFILISFLLYKLIHYHNNLNDPENTTLSNDFKTFLLIQHGLIVMFISWAIIQCIHIMITGHMLGLKNIMFKYQTVVP